MHSLVVGGTGILRSAAETLAERGRRVTVLARGATDEGPRRFAAAVDPGDAQTLGATLDGAIESREPETTLGTLRPRGECPSA